MKLTDQIPDPPPDPTKDDLFNVAFALILFWIIVFAGILFCSGSIYLDPLPFITR